MITKSRSILFVIFICLFILNTSAQNSSSININFFDSTRIYNSVDKIKKFETLRQSFLNIWLNDSNCYKGNSNLQKSWWHFYQMNIKKIYIDNIISTKNYDTLIVLVTGYAAKVNTENELEDRTFSVGMGVIINSLGQWEFNCNRGTPWITTKGDEHEKLILQLRKLILDAQYFKPDNTPDPFFWKRLYNNELWN